jgi:hypothetical protein
VVEEGDVKDGLRVWEKEYRLAEECKKYVADGSLECIIRMEFWNDFRTRIPSL